jgi:hypothetical protein
MLSLEEVSAITYTLGEFSFIFAMMSFFKPKFDEISRRFFGAGIFILSP